jgi:Protein of unknown function (DUF1761)
MTSSRVSPVPVVVAGIAYWLVQAGWYITLASAWQAGTGKTWAELQAENVAVSYTVSLICDLAVAYGISWVTGLTGERTAARGVQCAIYLWAFFVAAQLATNYAFENRTVTFFLINAGSALVGMIVIGAIVGAWRVKALAPLAAS